MPSIVITGASAGIGLAIADLFASRSWRVAIVARDPDRLEGARRHLKRHGGEVLAFAADASDATAVRALAKDVSARWGGIDAWVNNAMSTVVGWGDQITDAEYARVTQTTYLSQVYGTLAALAAMKESGQGAILQISSGLAIRAAPLQAAYCGAKAAIDGFTDALRTELYAQASGITLTTVYLPGVNTPQPGWARNHTGRAQVIPDPLFDPRLCAEAVWRAVDRPTRQVWVGRSTWLMALGQKLAPGFADRKAAEMAEAQLGAPQPPQVGNLDTPVAGPPEIDGPEEDRVVRPLRGYATSADAAIAAVVGLGLITAAASALGYVVGRGGRA